MSYRDLRNFTEMMRALGYPRLISMENFRMPNFPLVAEVLTWLVKRYDPNAEIPTDTELEQDRVIFVKSVAQFMATKAHIKLNTKKVYQADGYAVKELLKVTSVLYNAMKINKKEESEDVEDDMPGMLTYDISSKISDLKMSRQLASEVTSKGAALYDLLGQEVELREMRTTAINRPLEINEIEKGLKGSIKAVEQQIKKTQKQLENVAADEANLEVKIDKKKSELERNNKRLRTLQQVRPAYMDEFERLELDLEKNYEVFIEKFRNMAYMEHCLEEQQRADQDEFEDAANVLSQMQERIKDENVNGITGGEIFDEEGIPGLDVDDDDEDDEDDEGSSVTDDDDQQPPPRNMKRQEPARNGKVFGTMGGELSEDDDESGSESVTDDSIDVDDDDLLDDDDDDSDELEVETAPRGGRRARKDEDSDNDF
ncbi:clusterin-associated protein 1-like [Antedon mediterranea]|uniref:clusterin-associated protein 1-like n=1 Tax=Antedon mediterranea TaxID=105859 RepID=UPI003AF8E66E